MSIIEREIVQTIPEVIDPRVERGAALLDEKAPGWADKIDLGTLDTHGVVNCPLGQVFGGFGEGANALWGPEGTPSSLFKEHGFYTFRYEDDYEQVQQSWRLAVLSRRVG